MKPFVIYTALRIGLFVAVYWVLYAIAVIAGAGEDIWLPILIAAAVLSSVLSVRFLAGPREELAQRVAQRAQRAGEKFEEMRSREDGD